MLRVLFGGGGGGGGGGATGRGVPAKTPPDGRPASPSWLYLES